MKAILAIPAFFPTYSMSPTIPTPYCANGITDKCEYDELHRESGTYRYGVEKRAQVGTYSVTNGDNAIATDGTHTGEGKSVDFGMLLTMGRSE